MNTDESRVVKTIGTSQKIKGSTREALWGLLFLLPNLCGFLLFTSLPVLAALLLAFCEWDILTPPKWVGLRNFQELLLTHVGEDGKRYANDPLFWKYLYNTVFLMMAIPVNMLGSLLLATLMVKKIRGVVVFRTIFFLPTISAGVALCFLWKWLYASDLGLINMGISWVGDLLGFSWKGPQWLTSITWAKPALMLMGFWTALGGTNMILYMAALTNVPEQLYEAAEIDGAGKWSQFWRITVPMVSPTTFFILIMAIIGGFQGGFMQAYTMTAGGPAGSTTTIELYIYRTAYENFQMGYASAIACVLFVIILCITLVNWIYGGRRVNY